MCPHWGEAGPGRQGPSGEKHRHVMLKFVKYMNSIAQVHVPTLVYELKHAP
jgi:hypothetical protein